MYKESSIGDYNIILQISSTAPKSTSQKSKKRPASKSSGRSSKKARK